MNRDRKLFKHITRRSSLLFAILGILALVVTSCGGGAEPTATPQPTPTPTRVVALPTPVPTPTPAPTPTAAPKRGGVLDLRLLQRWPIRDTYDSRGAFSQQLTQSLMNLLVMSNPYNFKTSEEVIPDLARDWQISGDGKVLTFKLQQGVQWHDGTPFTSKDVVYSYNRAINPPSATVVYMKSKFAVVEKVEAPDANTVVVTLKRPSVSFVRNLALPFSQIYPAHIPDMAVFNEKLVGTGPFRLVSEKTDVEVIVERNPSYFKAGLPYLDGIHYLVIADSTSALAAFRTRRILAGTGTYDADYQGYNAREIRRDFSDVLSQPYTGSRVDFRLNNRGALSDRRVRQAINLGFDRKSFVQIWFPLDAGSTGTPTASPVLPPDRGGKWTLPEGELPKFDLARAKELLAEAGLAQGLKLENIGGTGLYQRPSEIAAELLKSIGIDAAFQVQSGPAVVTSRLQQGDFEVSFTSATALFDDPADNLKRIMTTGAGENYGKWSFPRIDQLFEEEDQILDESKRLQVILEVQREILKELPIIPLAWWGGTIFWQKEVKNYPRCYVPVSPCYKWEQVWLDRS